MIRLRSQSGFTLIEMLVGIVVTVIIGYAMVKLVTDSGRSSEKVLSVAQQNAMMRTAVTQLRNELGAADTLEAAQAFDSGAGTYPAIAVTRTVVRSDGTKRYLAELVAYRTNSSAATPVAALSDCDVACLAVTSREFSVLSDSDGDSTNDLTGWMRSLSTAQKLNPVFWESVSGSTKVLVDKLSTPTAARPLFRYMQAANQPASPTRLVDETSLVEVTLTRDEDAEISGSTLNDGTTTVDNPSAKLDTSIYMQRFGRRTVSEDADSAIC